MHTMLNGRNGGGDAAMTIQEFAREINSPRQLVKRMIGSGVLSETNGTLVYDAKGRPRISAERFFRVYRRHSVRRKPN